MTIEKCTIFILVYSLPMNVVTFPVLIDCIEQTCYTFSFLQLQYPFLCPVRNIHTLKIHVSAHS